jgi:hypothetical protein
MTARDAWIQLRRFSSVFPALLIVFLGAACATYKYLPPDKGQIPELSYPDAPPAQSIYLIGSPRIDLPVAAQGSHAIGPSLSTAAGEKIMIITGMRLGSIRRRDTLAVLDRLEEWFGFFREGMTRTVVIPGADDWAGGTRYGYRNVRLRQALLEMRLNDSDLVLPGGGCPGPEEITLGPGLVLLLIDTQWWLHEWEKSSIEEGCNARTEADFLANLEDALLRNTGKTIVVAAYHALDSRGERGGHFSWKSHIFPWAEGDRPSYLPMPGLGSLYVLYRSVLGEAQDQCHARYRQMIRAMGQVLGRYPDLIYLSASEHSLEYQTRGEQHFINSGSFEKGGAIAARGEGFSAPVSGFARLDVYPDGRLNLHIYDGSDVTGNPIFSRNIHQVRRPEPHAYPSPEVRPSYADSSATVAASTRYSKKSKRPGMLGNNYRQTWAMPIRVPYLDLATEQGGLRPLQSGGGQQTRSLRLGDPEERTWVIRSVEKYPEKAVPPGLRGTIAADVVRQQISASHPYAALMVPPLADAAGIYHTNPRLVWLPDDPLLGTYRHSFGNALYLFEERPEDEQRKSPGFGRPQEISSTPSVLKKMRKDADHQVDQLHVLRSRLFDMLIGDWDRHDDQWRWAEFEISKNLTLYRPIPRDRDQAFFWSDGWLMKLGTRRWGIRKFQGFHHRIRDIEGFNYNARYFDRTFLNRLELDDWRTVANTLKLQLPDSILNAATHRLPAEVGPIDGDVIAGKLKSRRDRLGEYAEQYYRFLAREVDVPGTDKDDLFEVRRLEDGQTRLSIYRLRGKNQKSELPYFQRLFRADETREIRLYGLDGDDHFVVSGEADTGIRLRIVGGPGRDSLENSSVLPDVGNQTWFYDNKKGTGVQTIQAIRNRTTDRDPLINLYQRDAFRYDLTTPIAYLNYNPDDGLFLGAGVSVVTHGFRKVPFKTNHSLRAELAPRSQSYGLFYKGHFTDLLGKWDLLLRLEAFVPSFTGFFYGYGNETAFDEARFEEDRGYYRARYEHLVVLPELQWNSDNELHQINAGGGYQSVNVRSSLNQISGQERFILSFAQSLPYPLLDVRRHYIAWTLRYSFDNSDSRLYPRRGFRAQAGLAGVHDIDGAPNPINFARWWASASYYYTFGTALRSTLALRAGALGNTGTWEFYHAPAIGGLDTFRGLRRSRLSGEQAFYQNTELRIRLVSFRSPLVPGDFGINMFQDLGRVWVDDDPSVAGGRSTLLHRSYGLGVWLAPLSRAAASLDYSWSNLGERAAFLRLGFMF